MVDPFFEAELQARRAARTATPWVEKLARLGYAARGVVYLVIGLIAARAGRGSGNPEDSQGALAAIVRQPYGKALLALVAVGLAGYAVWRVVQALADPEHAGRGLKGVVKRGSYAISAVVHAGIALAAARLVLGSASAGRGGDSSARGWTATLLEQPLGRWLVVVVGAGILAFGLYELYRAAASDPAKRLDLSGMGPGARRAVEWGGRAGWAARGVVFGVVGVFVVRAALRYDPAEARGMEGALEALRAQPYGPWLLLGVGVGLMAFGGFELVRARYRIIRPG